MHTSQVGRSLTESFEGFRHHAYRDGVGVLTIGFGHTNAAGGFQFNAGTVITRAQADEILAHDLLTFEPDVAWSFGSHSYSQNQFDACVDLAFNLGGPHYRESQVALCMRAGNPNGAASAFLRYVTAGGRFMQGLANRRHAEVSLFNGHVQHVAALAGVNSDMAVDVAKPDFPPISTPGNLP